MIKYIILLISALIIPGIGNAQIEMDQPEGFAGLLLGLASPTDVDSRFGYGAEVGLSFTNNWSLEGFFLSSGDSEGLVDTQLMHYGVGADYHLNPDRTGFRFGVRIGASTSTVSAPGIADVSDTEFTLGPHAGYDFPLSERFTVGGSAMWFPNLGDGEGSTLYVLGSGKFWF
jgi:hypothetical protein